MSEWDRFTDAVEDIVDDIGDELSRLTDPLSSASFEQALDSAGFGKRQRKINEAYVLRMRAIGGSEYEAARPTATAVRTAKGSGLQPGGTSKFVIPRSRKRQRGLISQFDLGGGDSLNVGGGMAGLQI